MNIKVLFKSKRGVSRIPEKQFELIKELMQKYPNALWRKLKPKNGQFGYELKV